MGYFEVNARVYLLRIMIFVAFFSEFTSRDLCGAMKTGDCWNCWGCLLHPISVTIKQLAMHNYEASSDSFAGIHLAPTATTGFEWWTNHRDIYQEMFINELSLNYHVTNSRSTILMSNERSIDSTLETTEFASMACWTLWILGART